MVPQTNNWFTRPQTKPGHQQPQQAAVNVTEEWTIEKLIISAHAMFHCYTLTIQHYANVRRITPVTAGMYSKWKVKTFILCQQFSLYKLHLNSWISLNTKSFRILIKVWKLKSICLHIFELGLKEIVTSIIYYRCPSPTSDGVMDGQIVRVCMCDTKPVAG